MGWDWRAYAGLNRKSRSLEAERGSDINSLAVTPLVIGLFEPMLALVANTASDIDIAGNRIRTANINCDAFFIVDQAW